MDSKTIVIDVRSMSEHCKYSIKNAYMMFCSNLHLKRYNSKLINISFFFINFKEMLDKLEQNYNIIIVVNQTCGDYLNILKEYFDMNNKSYSIYEFDEFMKIYSEKKKTDELSEIIPNLYLSGVEGTKRINENNISNVLSVMKNIPTFHIDIKHMKIGINDTYGQEIHNYFEEAHNFIGKALENNEKILVHCRAGISRSTTVVISYIMKVKKMNLDEAYKFVKSKRSIVNPNLDFYESLLKYEKELNI